MTEQTTSQPPAEDKAAQEDRNNRINAFLKGYGELVETHKIDFASYPMFVPDGQGGFKILVQNTPVDVSNAPVKSPIIATA